MKRLPRNSIGIAGDNIIIIVYLPGEVTNDMLVGLLLELRVSVVSENGGF